MGLLSLIYLKFPSLTFAHHSIVTNGTTTTSTWRRYGVGTGAYEDSTRETYTHPRSCILGSPCMTEKNTEIVVRPSHSNFGNEEARW